LISSFFFFSPLTSINQKSLHVTALEKGYTL
jgi:hypothetical protein